MNTMPQSPSVVFFGTPEFAAAQLSAIIEAGIPVKAVVTAPDKPAGRGKKLQQSAVKTLAISHDLVVLQPANLKDQEFIAELYSFDAELFVVVAFRMLPEVVWKMPPLGTFNLHASLLPQYRGAAPINRAIMNGEKVSGLTTFLLNEKIDEGNILMQKAMEIGADETAGSLHDRMLEEGKTLVVQTILGLANGSLAPQPQSNQAKLSQAPKIFKEDCRINWKKDIKTIYNHIRGLSPYPAAFTTICNEETKQEIFVKVLSASVVMETGGGGSPMQIETDNKSYLSVRHPEGKILLKEIQAPGKRAMFVKDFLNGFQLDGRWFVKE